MVFLDTNVFLYAAGRDHPLRAPAQRVLLLVEEDALAANTSVEVVQELIYVLWRRGARGEAVRLARHVLGLFPEILPFSSEDARIAVAILERHPDLSPRDAAHSATMRNHGLAEIVSADAHFDHVEGIRRIDLSSVGV
jgi:hypothetical protein